MCIDRKGELKMRAENFCDVKNQFVIYTKKAIVFQSYETPIAVYVRESGDMFVREEKFSRTTSKYTNRFLKEYPDAVIGYVHAEALDAIMEEI